MSRARPPRFAKARSATAIGLFLCLAGCHEPRPLSTLEIGEQLRYLDEAYEIASGAAMNRQWARFSGSADPGPAKGGGLLAYQRAEVVQWARSLEDPEQRRFARRLVPAVLEYANTSNPRISATAVEILELELEGHRLDGLPRPRRELLQILRSDADEDRKRDAWKALYAEPGWRKASSLRRLIELRGDLARRLGFADYEAMSFATIGVDSELARRLLGELEARTRAAAHGLARELSRDDPGDELGPWRLHRLDPELVSRLESRLDAEASLARARRTLADLGLPLPPTVRVAENSDAGQNEHFFTFSVSVPDDIRVMVSPDAGLVAQRSILHELGHATWLSRARSEHFVDRLPESRILSEGYAKLFERLVDEPRWLREVAGLDENTVEAVRSHQQRDELLRLRRLLALHEVESLAYREPGADLEAAFVAAMRRRAGIEIDLEDAEAWAAPSHLVTQPFSSMQYLLARVVAAQLRRALIERHGELIACKPCGDDLETMIETAASSDWEQLIVELSGQPLNADAYLEDVLALEPQATD